MGRRDALKAASATALFGLPLAAPAYDAIPDVDPDFEKMQKLREERTAEARKKTVVFNGYIKEIEAAADKDAYIAAADKFALFIIGEGKFPEGANIKGIVKRITLAYEDLPQKKYRCAPTRTNNGVCTTPGKDVEDAYQALVNQIDKYSRIVVGDYRTVTYKAF